MEPMTSVDNFKQIDIRVGEVIKTESFRKARKPAYKIWVDFGDEIGVKKSSAQVTAYYDKKELVGKQVIAVVNFPKRQIADFKSEILILGIYAEKGIVLLQPERPVAKGTKIG